MNRIETSHNELYIMGERSGSETITLTCNKPIEVTYEQFTNDLNGIVNVSIVDNFTTEVKFNVSYSDLYLNGETYSGVIHARLTGDVDKLDIPVVINCSDTLIYSDVPNDSVIDVLDGIHINYSSEPDINNVKLILEDGTEKNITYELSNQKIHISYLALLLDFGVIDYDYICASNGLSQISHKLKKVVYEFDLLKEKNIYIDYKEQWVEFKFTSKRNGEFIQFTYDSPFDGLEYYWHVDEDSNVVMRVKVPVNYEKERIIPITIKQDESKYIINVNIIQEKGELDFMFKSQNPIYVSDQESTVIVKILSYASGEYPLPIIGSLPSYIQHISTILNEDMVYEVKLKFEKNDLYKRGGKISFEQKDFHAFIYLKYYQDGLEFTPSGEGSSEDDNGNIMKGILGFWGLGNHIAQGDSGELIQKYSFIRRTINDDGEEELIELMPHRIIIDGTPDIVTWTEYNDDYTLPSYNKAMGIETSLDMNDIKIIPITKDVGQLLFYRSELEHLDSLDLPLIVTDNMFAYSKIKTVGTEETPLDLNNVEEANQMFMGSDTLSIYLNNTHNLKNASSMFDSSGFGENPVNINSENGVNLNLLGAVNIGGLFQYSNVYNINELLLSNKCTYISAAFRGCKYLEKIPLIECEGVTSADWLLSSCHNLVDVGGFKDLKCELDLTYCEKISKSSLMNIINYLGDVRYKGGDNLILNSRSLNMLSDDEKMIAVNKGWTIIVDNVIVDIKPISEENEFIYIAENSSNNKLYAKGNMDTSTSIIDAYLNNIVYNDYLFDGSVGAKYNYRFKIRGSDYSDLFSSCPIYRIVKLDTSHALEIAGLFFNNEYLISIPRIDVRFASDGFGMYSFMGCNNLVDVGGFIGLKSYTDLSYTKLLSHDSLINIMNDLAVVSSQTLKFGATNLAKLNDDEKMIAINKGWTIS